MEVKSESEQQSSEWMIDSQIEKKPRLKLREVVTEQSLLQAMSSKLGSNNFLEVFQIHRRLETGPRFLKGLPSELQLFTRTSEGTAAAGKDDGKLQRTMMAAVMN